MPPAQSFGMAQTATEFKISGSVRRPQMESAFYEISPFGTLATSVAIFAVLLASFGLAAGLDRYTPFVLTVHGWAIRPGIWPAFVIALLISVALGTQRYARIKDASERGALEKIMPACREFDARMYSGEAIRSLRWATGLGALWGPAVTVAVASRDSFITNPAVFVWFLIGNSLVGALFARGVVQSARGTRNWSAAIDGGIIVDLLRVDCLNVIGRYSARNALIWFSVAAVILLFFIGNNMGILTFGFLLFAAAMGVWIFLRPIERVHRRICAAKQAELDSIRHAIAVICARVPSDAPAASTLQGLLAYEARISSVREWPFDQPTAFRVAAYILIPAIAWFGQAIAGYFVSSFVHLPV